MSFSLRNQLSVLAVLLLNVATISSASSAADSSFKSTSWEVCKDYSDLECREVTVPRFYEPTTVVLGNAEGTLTNLERRVVSGKPKTCLASTRRVCSSAWSRGASDIR